METTIVRDLDLLKKMDDSEYINTIFKKANLSLYHRKKTYYDYEYNITKLAKDIKNKKTLVIPGIEYTNKPDYFNNLDYLTESLFIVPLISKVLKATKDYCYRNAFYYKFKSLYLEPILDAECTRMIHDNINYMEEKPFIICVESAISRMLTSIDHKYDFVTESIWKSVYKDLEKCNVKFFYASLNEYGQVLENTGRVFGNFKFKDYFVLNDTSGFIESAMETMSPSNNTSENIIMKVMTYDYRYDIAKLCKYFIKIAIIDFLKNEIINDFKKVYDDFNVNRMKNEIEISFIRNAKGISDYTNKLDDIYDYHNKFIEDLKCENKIFDFVADLRKFYSSVPEYLHLLKEASENPNESLISDCFVSEFAAIGHIEALNKNYTTAEKTFAVDSERLRSLFDQIIVLFKKLNKAINDNYLIFMSGTYFDYKTKDKITDRFDLISKLVEQMITCILIDPNSSYHNHDKDKIDDKFVWNVIDNCDVNFKYLKTRSNKERLTKFINTEVEFIKNIISIYESFVELKTEFDEIIKDWKNIMDRNIKYFYSYDPITELAYYLFSGKSLSGPEFIKFIC